jgi:hypothetical protein
MELVAGVIELPAGHWEVPRREDARGRLGYLILEGLLARDMTLAGRTATELLGEGDVVQPWVAHREDGLVRYRVGWNVLMPVRLAILDEDFGRCCACGSRTPCSASSSAAGGPRSRRRSSTSTRAAR